MVDIEKALRKADEMIKTGNTIVDAYNSIQMYQGAKKMLRKEKAGMSIDSGGESLRLRTINEILNTTVMKSTEKQIDGMIAEQEKCISELMGAEVEPVQKKAGRLKKAQKPSRDTVL